MPTQIMSKLKVPEDCEKGRLYNNMYKRGVFKLESEWLQLIVALEVASTVFYQMGDKRNSYK